jgi:hypothetical protein
MAAEQWRFEPLTSRRGDFKGYAVIDATGAVIAHTQNKNRARLLAMAPQLLAALKALAQAVEEVGVASKTPAWWDSDVLRTWLDAHEAIAEATTEDP